MSIQVYDKGTKNKDMLFNKRLSALFCSVFLLVSLICRTVNITGKLILAFVAIACFAAALFICPKQKLYMISIASAVILSVLTSVLYFNVYIKNIDSYDGNECIIEAVLLDSEKDHEHIIKINKIDGKYIGIKAKYHTDFNIYFDRYTVFTTKAGISAVNKYSSDKAGQKNYYMSRGILLEAKASEKIYETENSPVKPLEYYLGYVRDYASSVFGKYLSKNASEIADALVLGKRDRLDSQTKYNFRNLGISHILAISGMHFGILIGGLDFVLSKLSINKKLRNIINVFSVVFYLFLVGFSPSVTRSAIMLTLLFTSFNIGRKNDSVTSLLLAVFLICLFDPLSITDAGLMLSFTSTLGIITMASPSTAKLNTMLKEHGIPTRKVIMTVISPIIVCVSAVMFSLPVMWYYYGEISLITPVSNLLFALPAALLLYTAPLVILFSFFPFAAACIGVVTAFCAELMLNLSDAMSQSNYLISLESDIGVYIMILLISAYILFGSLRVKNRLYYYMSFVLCIIVLCLCPVTAGNMSENKNETVFITQDNAASFLITDGGKAMLCDFSDNFNTAISKGKSMLNSFGLTELDSYLMTGCNEKNCRTFINTASSIKVSRLFLPDTAESGISNDVLLLKNECKKRNIEITYYNTSYFKRDGNIKFGSTQLRISDISGKDELKSEQLIAEITQNGKNIMYIGEKVFKSSLGYTLVSERYNYISALVFGASKKTYGNSDYLPILFDSYIPLIFPSEAVFEYYKNTVKKETAQIVENNIYIIK